MAASRSASPLTSRALVGRRRPGPVAPGSGLVLRSSGLRRWRPSLARRPFAEAGRRQTRPVAELPVIGRVRPARRARPAAGALVLAARPSLLARRRTGLAGPPLTAERDRLAAPTGARPGDAGRRPPTTATPLVEVGAKGDRPGKRMRSVEQSLTVGRPPVRQPLERLAPGESPESAGHDRAHSASAPPALRPALRQPAVGSWTAASSVGADAELRVRSDLVPRRPVDNLRPEPPAALPRLRRRLGPAGQPLARTPSARPPLTSPVDIGAGRAAPVRPAAVNPGRPPAEPAESPERSWLAATAAQPLENPRPLPASWQPLAGRLAGTPNVRYTTGPATRAALAASGALGATTGRVIHLAREPVAADAAVVAHELAHARSPLLRPRFLLADHRHGDADEQAARTTTSRALAGGAGPASVRPAPEVARLPVGGAAVLVARSPAADLPATPELQPAAGSTAPSRTANVLAREAAAPTTTTTGASASAAADGAQPPATVDYDRLVAHLDRWLARELERRGGRYQGVF